MAGIAPFQVMELMARATQLEAAGRSVIHMEVGEPDFPTPQPVVDAAQLFLADGHVHYTPALGLAELRAAISRHYSRRYGVSVPAGRIVVTAGASGALLLALGVLVNPGSRVLVTDPGYPCNRHFVRLLEGRPEALPVGPETAFQPTVGQVAEAWNNATRALILSSPSNPTGTVMDNATLEGIVQVVRARGGMLIMDEIYHGLTYGFDADTALRFSDEVFVINSFSKYFNMTGWRLGWLVAPERYVREVEKLAQNLFIAPSTPAQYAALAAFGSRTLEILESRREEFRARRDLLVPALRQLGFTVPAEPSGAFYVYADCSAFSRDSFDFARRLLDEAGVAVTPGLDFGSHHAARYLRFAYTTSQEKIEEGLARIARYCGTA
ncbi:MAG: pyridoxal phosphate-dependent aminotransferase [Betaproteobacteria bacterium]|nr:pyridoxal phosphate-dependent aminotransferase [Betaproteobacteria bacterium]